MKRRSDRILTTHTGSLARVGEIAELLVARAKGEAVDSAHLKEVSRDAVRACVEPNVAWAKLRSLVEGAELASRQLW
jgi:5-methyltetrahydropteroyltriglutamate--homocysteine methyltransferase